MYIFLALNLNAQFKIYLVICSDEKQKDHDSSIKILMIFILKELRGIGGSHLKAHEIMKLILTSDRGGTVLGL